MGLHTAFCGRPAAERRPIILPAGYPAADATVPDVAKPEKPMAEAMSAFGARARGSPGEPLPPLLPSATVPPGGRGTAATGVCPPSCAGSGRGATAPAQATGQRSASRATVAGRSPLRSFTSSTITGGCRRAASAWNSGPNGTIPSPGCQCRSAQPSTS